MMHIYLKTNSPGDFVHIPVMGPAPVEVIQRLPVGAVFAVGACPNVSSSALGEAVLAAQREGLVVSDVSEQAVVYVQPWNALTDPIG